MTEWVEKHVNRYMYNVRLAIGLGDRDVGVAYFFQPTMLAYMEDWLTPREKDFLDPSDYATEFHGYSLRGSKQAYYFRVREEFKKLVSGYDFEYSTIADLSQLFDNKSSNEAYFGDHVHYLPKGRAIIAGEIADIIKPRLEEKIRLDPRFQECLVGS